MFDLARSPRAGQGQKTSLTNAKILRCPRQMLQVPILWICGIASKTSSRPKTPGLFLDIEHLEILKQQCRLRGVSQNGGDSEIWA